MEPTGPGKQAERGKQIQHWRKAELISLLCSLYQEGHATCFLGQVQVMTKMMICISFYSLLQYQWKVNKVLLDIKR